MKIVKPGKLEVRRTPGLRRGRCERCGCVVEADGTDPEGAFLPGGNAPERPDDWYGCSCPTARCGQAITLELVEKEHQ